MAPWHSVYDLHPPIGSAIEVRVANCPNGCCGNWVGSIKKVLSTPPDLDEPWVLDEKASLYIAFWRYLQ